MSFSSTYRLLKATAVKFVGDNTFQLGAALAYYTVFSLAPLVLIALAIAGMVFGREAAQERLSQEMAGLAGNQVGQSVLSLAISAEEAGSATTTTVVGVILLLIGASTVVSQLQASLNTIWGVKLKKDASWWITIRRRLFSFGIVLAIGFLLLVSLILSTMLTALSGFLNAEHLPGGPILWQIVNFLVSFGIITALFALLYKFLPDAKIQWGDVWIGAAITALLFSIGKFLIGLYLGQSGASSTYGAAGGLVIVLLWVYYSSQIFLLGAEFTQVFAQSRGSGLKPADYAQLDPDQTGVQEKMRAELVGDRA